MNKMGLDGLDTDVWSIDAWTSVLTVAQQAEDAQVSREIYERFLQQFPTSGRYWSLYAELELRQEEPGRAEQIFARSLQQSLHVDVWKAYMHYVKTYKSEQLGDAYEYSVNMIGLDIHSTPIWLEYIQYLKSLESNTSLDLLRKVYRRAVTTPIQGMEQIWKDYNNFENGLNRLTARKILADVGPTYMTARSVFRERRILMDNVNRNMIARPPDGNEREEEQLAAWKQVIRWEKRNPLKLEDPLAVQERVLFSYKQALTCLRFYPELWYDAIQYLYFECHRTKEGDELFRQALLAVPHQLVLHLTFTEIEEWRKNIGKAKEIYETLATTYQKRLDGMTQEKKRLAASLTESTVDPDTTSLTKEKDEGDEEGDMKESDKVASASSHTNNSFPPTTVLMGSSSEMTFSKLLPFIPEPHILSLFSVIEFNDEERAFRKRFFTTFAGPDRGLPFLGLSASLSHEQRMIFQQQLQQAIDQQSRELSLLYIHWLRMTHRVDGMRAVRLLFSRARKLPYCTYHVYVVSALLEFVCHKDVQVGLNIFRVGYAQFGEELPFLTHYVDYLERMNDDNNIRALYEKCLSSMTDREQLKCILDDYLSFETQYGDMVSIKRIEQRRRELEHEQGLDHSSTKEAVRNKQQPKSKISAGSGNQPRELAIDHVIEDPMDKAYQELIERFRYKDLLSGKLRDSQVRPQGTPVGVLPAEVSSMNGTLALGASSGPSSAPYSARSVSPIPPAIYVHTLDELLSPHVLSSVTPITIIANPKLPSALIVTAFGAKTRVPPMNLLASIKKPVMPRPDIVQMATYKPTAAGNLGPSASPTGPLPPALQLPIFSAIRRLLGMLPLPSVYTGPVLSVEDSIGLLMAWEKSNIMGNASGLAGGANEHQRRRYGGKRHGRDSDSEPEGDQGDGHRRDARGEGSVIERSGMNVGVSSSGASIPSTDIYRQRQQRRLQQVME